MNRIITSLKMEGDKTQHLKKCGKELAVTSCRKGRRHSDVRVLRRLYTERYMFIYQLTNSKIYSKYR